MATQQSKGAPQQGLAGIEGLVTAIDALEKAKKAGKGVADEFAGLNKRLALMAKEAKRSKDPVNVLAKAFLNLKTRSTGATDAIEIMAKQIEDSAGIMSTASAKSLQDTIEGIKKMEAKLVASKKGDSREMAILNTKRSKLEMERFRDERNALIGRAKMLQQGSEGVLGVGKGVALGVANAAMKHGADAAEFLGNALGLETEAMMAVAAVAGFVSGVFMAFNMAAKELSKQFTDMAKGGETLSTSMTEVVKYYDEVNAAAFNSGMTFNKMQELMVDMNKEFGRSIGLTAGFAGDVANVGLTFGMANEESVKLAARMGVLSRTMNQTDLKRSFAELGMQAGNLKIPMDALAEPMMALSELAGNTGHSVTEATNGLDLIIQSVKSLGSSGKAMFQNMHGGDIAKMTKEFAGFIAGMDEWTLAAITFKENESFQQTSDRITKMGTKERIGALKQMFTDSEATSSVDKGMLMGAKNFSEAERLGGIATNAIDKGMSDKDFSDALAKSLDDQLNDRKTVGERIQLGQDPTGFIMDRLQKLLASILHIESVVTMFSSKSGQSAATVATSTGRVAASQTAYAAQVQAQRPDSVPGIQ